MKNKLHYINLDEEPINKWVDTLVYEKNEVVRANNQLALIKAIKEMTNDEFVNYIEQIIADKSEDKNKFYQAIEENQDENILSDFKNVFVAKKQGEEINLQPGHMYFMPPEDVIKFYNQLNKLPIDLAIQNTFWLAITLFLIRNKIIEENSWLCVDKELSQAKIIIDRIIDPKNSIQDLIANTTKIGSNIGLQGLTFRVLRYLFGPMQLRGGSTLYSNSTFAKAWWCGNFATRSFNKFNNFNKELDFNKAVYALNLIWYYYADKMMELPILREESVVFVMIELSLKANRKTLSPEINDAIEKISKASVHRAVGLLNPEEIKKDILNIE